MKIISFNVNGLRARLHQLNALIESHQPDIIGLQETKVDDSQFPQEALEKMGYQVEFFGQKGHYGVCLMSKIVPTKVQKGFLSDSDEAQKRFISATYPLADGSSITVMNGYFPQGDNINHPTKFPAKRRFYADLLQHLNNHHHADEALVVMGDLNISAEDCDIGIGEANRKRWLRTGKASFQPEEREWLEQLKAWGLQDCYRHLHGDRTDALSWFDYRSRGFEAEPKRGLRIDALLATPCLLERCLASGIDLQIRAMEKPSDHAPVWSEFDC